MPAHKMEALSSSLSYTQARHLPTQSARAEFTALLHQAQERQREAAAFLSAGGDALLGLRSDVF